MRIEVQLFAVLRERAGRDRVEVEMVEGATVGELIEAVAAGEPSLREPLGAMPVVIAVNREYAAADQELNDGDEVALVPPVSGGSGSSERLRVQVTDRSLVLDRLAAWVTVPEAGAVVTFSGVTREVERLEYEAYVPMAERRMTEICEAALATHGVERIAAEHRVGPVALGEASVIVAASSAHRPAAFAAAREVIDRLKAEAPIWKQEVDGGSVTWVEGTPPPAA